jgi:hypothetical protein
VYNNSGGFNSHGHDSSLYGVRHYEIYQNSYTFDSTLVLLYPFDPTFILSYSTNVNWNVWMRGGTGVIYSNAFADMHSTDFGDKYPIAYSIRAIEDDRIQGDRSCGAVSYPVPQQLGQSHNGSTSTTDMIWMWSNTKNDLTHWHGARFGGNGWGNPCGFTFSDFFASGRDYTFSGGDGLGSTAKPGYAAFTYPHPLLDGSTPPPNVGPIRYTMA